MIKRNLVPMATPTLSIAKLHQTRSPKTQSATPNPVSAEFEHVFKRPNKSAQPTVLLLSDDFYARTTLQAYLQHLGISVRCCADATRFPEMFVRGPDVNLLLIDTCALGMTILRLAIESTAFRPELPVLVIAPPEIEMSPLLAATSGNWRWVRKPVHLPELLEQIQIALDDAGVILRGRATSERRALICQDDLPDLLSNPLEKDLAADQRTSGPCEIPKRLQ